MNPLDQDPLEYFRPWMTEPIMPSSGRSVLSVVNALNNHPLARDERAQDSIMPPSRYGEKEGRFRFYAENQDCWHCFVQAGAELEVDPPVYFETCLDLRRDCGCSDAEILGGDHVLVCQRFTDFLWFLLARHFCIRLEGADYFAPGVQGLHAGHEIAIDGSFQNPLGREFPAGYSCYVGDEAVCVPEWGAAFLNRASCDRFLWRYSPVIEAQWP